MAKVGRPKKVVETVVTSGNNDTQFVTGMNAWPSLQPESREQFIERVSVGIVTNIRDFDTLKQGKSMATAAFNMATQLADLLQKRNPGD